MIRILREEKVRQLDPTHTHSQLRTYEFWLLLGFCCSDPALLSLHPPKSHWWGRESSQTAATGWSRLSRVFEILIICHVHFSSNGIYLHFCLHQITLLLPSRKCERRFRRRLKQIGSRWERRCLKIIITRRHLPLCARSQLCQTMTRGTMYPC